MVSVQWDRTFFIYVYLINLNSVVVESRKAALDRYTYHFSKEPWHGSIIVCVPKANLWWHSGHP